MNHKETKTFPQVLHLREGFSSSGNRPTRCLMAFVVCLRSPSEALLNVERLMT